MLSGSYGNFFLSLSEAECKLAMWVLGPSVAPMGARGLSLLEARVQLGSFSMSFRTVLSRMLFSI